jgi:hypothetical protein
MRWSHKLWLIGIGLGLPHLACATGVEEPSSLDNEGGALSGESNSDDSGIPTLPPPPGAGASTPPGGGGTSSYDSGSGSGKSGKSSNTSDDGGYSDYDGGGYSSYDSSYEEDSGYSYDSGGSGKAPKTCTEADSKVGCCDGNVLYYCETSTVTSKKCTGSDVCGWDSTSSYYGCVAAPGGADPSGTYPLTCK